MTQSNQITAQQQTQRLEEAEALIGWFLARLPQIIVEQAHEYVFTAIKEAMYAECQDYLPEDLPYRWTQEQKKQYQAEFKPSGPPPPPQQPQQQSGPVGRAGITQEDIDNVNRVSAQMRAQRAEREAQSKETQNKP